jgi:hypothetical protein
MKPDVAWPAEVQQVMDKALARDAKERYQSAAQFGRELWAACESMPASQAAEAGTQVLSAPASAAAGVPKTRVATPGEGGKTVAAPSPAAKSAPAAAAPASVAVKKSNTTMIAAAVIGIAVLGGGGYFMLGGKGAATPAASDSAAVVQGPTGQPQTAAPSTTPSNPGGVTQLNTKVNPGGGNGRTQGGAQEPVAPVASDPLLKWKAVADGDTPTNDEARDILTELRPVANNSAGERKAQALYVMGQASMKLGNTEDACTLWKRAEDLNSGMFANRAKSIRGSFCE